MEESQNLNRGSGGFGLRQRSGRHSAGKRKHMTHSRSFIENTSDMSTSTGQLQVTKSVLIWEIKNFTKQCYFDGQSIVSPTFQLGDVNDRKRNETKWRLQLYRFGVDDLEDDWDDEGYFSLYLVCVPTYGMQFFRLEWSYKFSILDNTGNHLYTKILQSVKGQFDIPSPAWGQKLINESDLFHKESGLLKEDTLRIVFSTEEKWIINKEDDVSIDPLINHFRSLYVSEEFSDITIVIKDKEIKAHKCILSCRSKVFSAMLNHNMVESNTSTISIDDIDYNVMNEFLLFLYCGKLPIDTTSTTESLLAASDKYDVMELKHICERRLWSAVTVDNACETLSIAELHNCKELRSDVIDYIITNLKKVVSSKSFDELSNSNPALFKEILIRISEYKISK